MSVSEGERERGGDREKEREIESGRDRERESMCVYGYIPLLICLHVMLGEAAPPSSEGGSPLPVEANTSKNTCTDTHTRNTRTDTQTMYRCKCL